MYTLKILPHLDTTIAEILKKITDDSAFRDKLQIEQGNLDSKFSPLLHTHATIS